MKTDEIFEEMDFEGLEEEFEDDEVYEVGDEPEQDDYYQFDPVSVTLDEDEIVAIVKDGETIDVDEWGAIKEWVNENWEQLNGTYHITQNGATIYSFSNANI